LDVNELFHTDLGDGTIEGNISNLSIHIVDGSSGLVSKNNSVGLDDSLVLFVDLKGHIRTQINVVNISYFADADDFTLGSLELVKSSSLEPSGLRKGYTGR
jgi:hypothetical protein